MHTLLDRKDSHWTFTLIQFVKAYGHFIRSVFSVFLHYLKVAYYKIKPVEIWIFCGVAKNIEITLLKFLVSDK